MKFNLKRLFRKSQGSLFTGYQPTQQTLGFAEPGGERPGHKYIRRFRGQDGKWRYIYEETETGAKKTFDGGGNEMETPDIKPGHSVYHQGKEAHVHKVADNIVTLKNQQGEIYTAKITDIETDIEYQSRIGESRKQALKKYQDLLSILENDYLQGKKSGKYEHSADSGEAWRKIKYAKEEIERRGGKPQSRVDTASKKLEFKEGELFKSLMQLDKDMIAGRYRLRYDNNIYDSITVTDNNVRLSNLATGEDKEITFDDILDAVKINNGG